MAVHLLRIALKDILLLFQDLVKVTTDYRIERTGRIDGSNDLD